MKTLPTFLTECFSFHQSKRPKNSVERQQKIFQPKIGIRELSLSIDAGAN